MTLRCRRKAEGRHLRQEAQAPEESITLQLPSWCLLYAVLDGASRKNALGSQNAKKGGPHGPCELAAMLDESCRRAALTCKLAQDGPQIGPCLSQNMVEKHVSVFCQCSTSQINYVS